MTAPEQELATFLWEQKLAAPGEEGEWIPLTGGVSSDIWRVETGRGTFCIKRALARLKVSARWEAPVDRNAFEWAYLNVASEISPGSVPRPIAHDPALGLLAMAWLAPDRHKLWKSELLHGDVDPDFAGLVGGLLGRIHAATSTDKSLPARFPTDRNFYALRLDPYLLETARQHPDLAGRLESIARTTAATKWVLVHGDVSPKNILMGPEGPVLLDAEVAWFGDPAFDVAFCLTHLTVKVRVLPSSAKDPMTDSIDRFASSYFSRADWEPEHELERRVAALLPALSLARVDGKSPLEYLDEEQRSGLRAAARAAILADKTRLSDAVEALLV